MIIDYCDQWLFSDLLEPIIKGHGSDSMPKYEIQTIWGSTNRSDTIHHKFSFLAKKPTVFHYTIVLDHFKEYTTKASRLLFILVTSRVPIREYYISIQEIKTAFHTSSERITRPHVSNHIFSLKMHAEPKLAHRQHLSIQRQRSNRLRR